jgi:hypothetical protein
MNWSGYLKSSASRNRLSHDILTMSSRLLVVAGFLCFGADAHAKPRMPLPPFPPPAPVLYSESFDEAYTVWMTNAEVTAGDYTYDESWSGYALQRTGTVTPFLVPGVDDAGHTNLAASGAIEFWFKPDWSSVSVTNGTGPGEDVPLLEWTALANNRATVIWSLEASANGSVLALLKPGNGGPNAYLSKTISWKADQWHLLTLDYSTTNTVLFIDGKLAAQGAGTPPVSVAAAALSLGSTLTGGLAADGDFDEFYCFGRQLRTNDVTLYYEETSGQAALGPVSEAEIEAQQAAFALRRNSGGTFGAMDSGGFSPDYSGGSSNLYGSNVLWLSIFPPGTNAYATNTNSLTVTVILNNTIANVAYELFSTTNLSSNITWALEQTLNGSGVTNYTVTFVPMAGRTNLFFKALAGNVDSDGDGLPDWWELAYSTTNYPLSPTNADTGNTGIMDGYKQDSAGDGYNNLQKYQMGVPPNVPVAPPAPADFSAVLNTGGTSATLTWPPSPFVQSYTVWVIDDQTGESLLTNLPASQTNFTDSSSTFSDGIQYQLQANYADGASAVSGQDDPTIEPSYTTQTAIVRGPQGGLYLVVSTIPSNVVAIRVYWGRGVSGYPTYNYNNVISGGEFTPPVNNTAYNYIDPNYYFDVPVSSFTNGVYQIPTNKASLFGYYNFATQAVGADGMFGNLSTDNGLGNGVLSGYAEYTWRMSNIPFLDGRTNIQQNTSFLLRGAMVGEPFFVFISTYAEGYPGYYWEGGYSNYVSTGFYFDNGGYPQIDEFHPFMESSLYDYLVYQPGIIGSSGFPTNGVEQYYQLLFLSDTSHFFNQYNYVTSGNYSGIAPVLGSSAYSIMSFRDFDYSWYPLDGCVSNTANVFTLQSTSKNLYGLSFNSIMYPESGANEGTDLAGNSFNYGGYGFWFHNVAAPSLSTVGYYFARGFSYVTPYDPLPGESGFSTTNTTASPLIVGVGQSFTISAWAKQAVANGYGNVFAYPEEYFDKAYKTDTNGNITTNQTGILSEYGEFFATDPGKVILTTKPDGATGSTGQCAVNVIKMALDVNHDGTMDLTYTGPDNTSADRPFKFWVNDDDDVAGLYGDLDFDANAPQFPDYNYSDPIYGYGKTCIHSKRDLEDYARLWICGMPALTNAGYQVSMNWNVSSGNPVIKLFQSAETNGGTLYLTDTNVAAAQVAAQNTVIVTNGFAYSVVGPGVSIGTVSNGATFTFPTNYFTNGATKYLLFEGAGVGEGELVLTVSQNGTNIASTSVFMSLMEVSDMIERAHIENAPVSPPSTTLTDQSTYKEDNFVPIDAGDGKQLIVFVHGWRLTQWGTENFAETMFKRLWWQGYQGRFAALRWPTLSAETDGPLAQYLTFNRDEYISFDCAQGTANYFLQLQSRFPGYSIDVCSHSHGNVLMMETLKRFVTNGQTPIHNYALLQAAVAGECLDTNALLFPPFFIGVDELPDNFQGYAGPVQNALTSYNGVSGKMANFYNTNDFGVVTCWQPDQLLYKPDGRYGYQYVTNGAFQSTITSTRAVTDPHELMSFLSRPRTQAVGAMPGLGGALNTGNQVDLQALVGFTGNWYDHSGEFNRPIQQLQPFYTTLLDRLQQ